MTTSERYTPEPEVDWVNTTAGGEQDPGDASVAGSPGSGVDDNTRAGLPNADPDGYDYERSDLQGIDIGDSPIAEDK